MKTIEIIFLEKQLTEQIKQQEKHFSQQPDVLKNLSFIKQLFSTAKELLKSNQKINVQNCNDLYKNRLLSIQEELNSLPQAINGKSILGKQPRNEELLPVNKWQKLNEENNIKQNSPFRCNETLPVDTNKFSLTVKDNNKENTASNIGIESSNSYTCNKTPPKKAATIKFSFTVTDNRENPSSNIGIKSSNSYEGISSRPFGRGLTPIS